VDGLRASFYDIVAKSRETQTSWAWRTQGPRRRAGEGRPAPSGGKTPHLDQYTVNLTANAKAGKIDPVLGRDQRFVR
jgi:type VI secretion system protein VasG